MNVKTFFTQFLGSEKPVGEIEDLPVKGIWIGWMVVGLLVLINIHLFNSFGFTPSSLILVCFTGLYFLASLHVNREPMEAVLFRFGKAVMRLRYGWWVTIIPIHSIEAEVSSRQILNEDDPSKEEADLYYIVKDRGDDEKKNRKIAVKVKMRVFFRLENVYAAIRTYGGLNTFESRADIFSTSFAALRATLGGKNFSELLTDAKGIQTAIENLTNEELKRTAEDEKGSGYIIESVDIYDYKEEVQSVASATREQAEAEAFRAGEITKATAEPLKNNPDAARVNVANAYANAAREVLPEIAKILARAFGGGKSSKSSIDLDEKTLKKVEGILGKVKA